MGVHVTELTVAVTSLLNSWTPSPTEIEGSKLILLTPVIVPQFPGDVLFCHVKSRVAPIDDDGIFTLLIATGSAPEQ